MSPQEDVALSNELLKTAGVSRGGKIATAMLVMLLLLGGGAFGVYYIYGQKVPNPPRTQIEHAAMLGIELGTAQFPQGATVAVVYQPPTMLLAQGKATKRPKAKAVAPRPAPKPTPAPAPKVEAPKPTPPAAPKLRTVPRNN